MDYGSWLPPRVSVVTPCYNQGLFLEETIRSVLLQGYLNLESIIMDGRSNDDSVDIIRRYAPWLAFWTSEGAAGQASAVNKGRARSQEQVLIYLNSGDVLERNAVSRAVHALMTDERRDIVFGSFNPITERGVRSPTVHPAPFDFRRALFTRCLCHPTMFLRRRLLDIVGLLDEELAFTLDHELWVRTAPQGCVFLRLAPPPLANCRQWAGAESWSRGEQFAQERFRMVQKHFPHCDSERSRLAWAGAFHDAAWFQYATASPAVHSTSP